MSHLTFIASQNIVTFTDVTCLRRRRSKPSAGLVRLRISALISAQCRV